MPDADRTRRELRNRARLALWLAVPFIALMLLVSPRGDFPLNDDWVYAKMVQALANDGHFGLSPFSNAYALTQTLYAAPLVKLFGFSFTLLRLTTIFMGWVTVCFTAFTARELGLSNRAAVLAALTVFVNPLFINLSYTFMTDVPFCAFAMISTYYFVKALHRPTTVNLLLGTLFSIAAFYDRQFGALIPVAFMLASVPRWRATVNTLSRKGLVALTVPWVICLAPIPWLAVPADQRIITTDYMSQGWNDWFVNLTFTVPVSLAYLGLFLSPLAVARFVQELRNTNLATVYELPSAIILSLVVAALFVFFRLWFVGLVYMSPPQIIRNSEDVGVGLVAFSFLRPPSMDDWIPSVVSLPSSPGFAIVVLTSGACLAALFAVSLVARIHMSTFGRVPVRRSQWLLVGLLLPGTLLIAPRIAMSGFYFDRYYLAAMPFLALLAVSGVRTRLLDIAHIPTYFLLASLCAFSILSVQDNMAWNTSRWHAIDILRSKYKVPDEKINAGFEFNGMFTSDEYIRRLRGAPKAFDRKKWWVVGETYCVSPVDLTHWRDHYEILEEVPYYSWLGFETRQIYLLRRTDSTG